MIHGTTEGGVPSCLSANRGWLPRLCRQRPTLTACAVLAIAMLVAGCKRQPEEATQAPSNLPADQGSLGAPVAPAEVQRQTLDVPKDATPDAVLEELNRELRRWLIRNQRRPASFEEIVSTSQMQVPPAPAGKKYTLSKEMRIVLVDQ